MCWDGPGYWTEEELPAVLEDFAEAMKPRLFAFCELRRDGDRVLDTRIYAWGVDFNRRGGDEEDDDPDFDIDESPGAVLFADDNSMHANPGRPSGCFRRFR